jgi:hypothetical protein
MPKQKHPSYFDKKHPSPFDVSLNIAESDILIFENLNKDYHETLQQYEIQKKKLLTDIMSPPSSTPIRCGANHFCVNVKNNEPYCYGDPTRCLWNSNDCETDFDCTKYDVDTSPQFSPGASCPTTTTTTKESMSNITNNIVQAGNSIINGLKNTATSNTTNDTWTLNACQLAKASLTDTRILDALNSKLISLTENIQDQNKAMKTSTEESSNLKQMQASLLVKKYQTLLEERQAVEEALREHQTADEEYNQQQMLVDENNSRFLLWVYFCFLVIAYLVKVIFFADVEIQIFRSILLSAMGFLFLVATFYLYIPQIFFLWLTVIAFFFLSFYKMIPF